MAHSFCGSMSNNLCSLYDSEGGMMDNCPNKKNHVSAWPAFDRELCPYCRKTYVRKAK